MAALGVDAGDFAVGGQSSFLDPIHSHREEAEIFAAIPRLGGIISAAFDSVHKGFWGYLVIIAPDTGGIALLSGGGPENRHNLGRI